jgi:hypothetical protein
VARIELFLVALSCAILLLPTYARSTETGARSGGAVSEEVPSEPVMTAQVISLTGPARVSSVHGRCYLVRDDSASIVMKVGQALRNGDVIDLDENGAVTIRASGKTTVMLRRSNGRFFKLEMRP